MFCLQSTILQNKCGRSHSHGPRPHESNIICIMKRVSLHSPRRGRGSALPDIFCLMTRPNVFFGVEVVERSLLGVAIERDIGIATNSWIGIIQDRTNQSYVHHLSRGLLIYLFHFFLLFNDDLLAVLDVNTLLGRIHNLHAVQCVVAVVVVCAFCTLHTIE